MTWVEAEPVAKGIKSPEGRAYFHRYKIRFDWVPSQGEPWWNQRNEVYPSPNSVGSPSKAFHLRSSPEISPSGSGLSLTGPQVPVMSPTPMPELLRNNKMANPLPLARESTHYANGLPIPSAASLGEAIPVIDHFLNPHLDVGVVDSDLRSSIPVKNDVSEATESNLPVLPGDRLLHSSSIRVATSNEMVGSW